MIWAPDLTRVPFVCQPVANVLAQLPRRALIAAMNVGANGADTFKAAQPSTMGKANLIKLDSSACTPNTNIDTMT